jgi:SPP1 gp7 family putative phage head morphogenesis protein
MLICTYSKVQDSVYIGMLKGESMKKVADRIQQVTGSDEATAIRNARTSVISASNQGKMATFERAAKMGIKVKKEWVSARDNRVRDSHAALNGVQVEWDKKFPNGLKCPCDPSGRPEEVYNCRCTMVRVPFDEEDTSGNTEKNYQAWKESKEEFTRRYVADDGHEIIDKATYEKLTKTFTNSGGIIIRGDEAARHLKASGASAAYISGANIAFIRDDATISDVLEEMYHAKQDRANRFGKMTKNVVLYKREVEAQEYLLSVSKKYNIPDSETKITKENLKYWKQKLEEATFDE